VRHTEDEEHAMPKPDDMPRHDDPTELEPRPRPPRDDGPRATVAQLRRDIDSGATGDKVPVLDPASAPLGTDDEAAGAPPPPELVADVRRAERADRRAPLDPTDNDEDPRGLRLIGAVALAVALAAVALWFSFA
jgi:hypothetical protein